jgi:NADH-quinone oxidoreductase subunit C
MDVKDLTVEKIRAALPEAISATRDFRGERTLRIRREDIVAVCRLLRDDPELDYNYLSDLSGTDYWPAEPRFCVNYHLLAMGTNTRLRLSVYLTGDDAVVASVTGVWPAALWHMFGVSVSGHPDLRRILMPAEWVGHPQRKDYPLGYEDVQYTHNVDEIQRGKPRPKPEV